MRTLSSLVPLAAAVFAGCVLAQEPEDEVMVARTFESGTAKLPYRWFAPEREGDAAWPLVIFLHGAGERGTDNRRQLRHGVRTFVTADAQERHPCFVAAPQCPRGRWWDPELLQEFAAALAQQPGVDPDRVYLTGLSMGGYATWHVAGARPDLFAAALPVCGGGKVEDALALSTIPIRAFHGDADRTVPVAQSRTMVEAIRRCGGDVQYTEYPGVGHDSWTRTYADREVHDWLFAQRRRSRTPPLANGDRIVFFGDSITEAGAKEGGYVQLFAGDLRQRRPGLEIEIVGAGISGNRVPDLLARFERDVAAKEPTVVVVYIGINDVWHHQHGRGTPREEFESGLRDLLGRIEAAGARALLCTPSVIGEKPPGENALDGMLDDYAAVARRVADAAHVPVLDLRRRFVTALAALASQEGQGAQDGARAEQGALTTDGVHLNPAGNRLVADGLLGAFGVFAPSGPAAGK